VRTTPHDGRDCGYDEAFEHGFGNSPAHIQKQFLQLSIQATIPDVLPREKDYTKAHPDTAPGALRQGRQMLSH
ncbi:hypothetical protein, partial [Mesorhizobium sp.]|uniref:hypothetical protein n=1 Tax=Mesorhizobium sp. TaxID=1871066 RepID=UPI0025BFFDEB